MYYKTILLLTIVINNSKKLVVIIVKSSYPNMYQAIILNTFDRVRQIEYIAASSKTTAALNINTA